MPNNQLDLSVAGSIPPQIHFGTSTWTYPGWKGQIYKENYKSDKEFRSRSLGEYARCPLFRTVGIDNTFYAPPTLKQLEGYAALVPESYVWVQKVWERITIPQFPKHARYGKHAGQANPDFLKPETFVDAVLTPNSNQTIRHHTGPFVFQFPTIAKAVLEETAFFDRLGNFFRELPREFKYAVEIRNPAYLNSSYFSVLNEFGVTHCFNHWNYMPSLRDQMKRAAEAGGLSADFFVARILTPRGLSYQDAVKRFQPYSEMKEPNPSMRKDIVTLAKRAVERNVSAFVIVNNRAEGNAPMTIDALGRMIVAEI